MRRRALCPAATKRVVSDRCRKEFRLEDCQLLDNFETKANDQWLAEVIEALQQHPDHRVVCVDIHC